MTEWSPRRFWREVTVVEAPGGWTVQLDGKRVMTPARQAFLVPTASLAEASAEEWAAQTDRVDPRRMPLTRAANAAIDKIAPQRAEVAAYLASYGETDLLSYRAPEPAALRARQDAAWDPLLDWLAEAHGARLALIEGVMPKPQDPVAVMRLGEAVAALGTYELTGLSEMVSLTGSLVLGLALLSGRLEAGEAWRLSRIDEEWQIEQWGADEEAAEEAAARAAALTDAERFVRLARG